ncbi:phage major capsid protein [bacterium]|nr:phage major capsid protein [bacterium]
MKFPSVTQWLGRPAPDRCRSVPLLLLFLCALPLQAAEEVDPTLKLREQLRGVMLQLRTSQTEAANALAAQAAAEKTIAGQTAKLAELDKRQAALVKQGIADKTASDETIAKLNNKLAEREKRLVEITANRDEWKTGYQKAAAVANTKEDERAKLASEVLVNKRSIADLQAKNMTLFSTANEILDRYENYALGKALGAREPFIGTTRVKIENQVQGYKDKVLDNRISAPAKP